MPTSAAFDGSESLAPSHRCGPTNTTLYPLNLLDATVTYGVSLLLYWYSYTIQIQQLVRRFNQVFYAYRGSQCAVERRP